MDTPNTTVDWKEPLRRQPYQARWYKDGVLYIHIDTMPHKTKMKLDEMVRKIMAWLRENKKTGF